MNEVCSFQQSVQNTKTHMNDDSLGASTAQTTSSTSTSTSTNNNSLTESLKRFFGFDAFRHPQVTVALPPLSIGRLFVLTNLEFERKLAAIQAVLAGDDVLVRAATGVGKSLCYQLPAAMALDHSVVVVISPLIALMLDQTTQMKRRNISALYLASDHEDPLGEQQLMAGDVRIVYMSPERAVLHIDFLKQLHSSTRISLFAIDEVTTIVRQRFKTIHISFQCHTVSEWGHDFRPAYRQLAALRDNFPNGSYSLSERIQTFAHICIICSSDHCADSDGDAESDERCRQSTAPESESHSAA